MNKINDIKKYLFFLLITFSSSCFSQQLYIKTYGNQSDKPLLFLHGGPGYNCASFEFTTAEKYPEKGNAIFLIGAPISLQESFSNILQKCKTIYETKKNQVNLNYLKMLENIDKNSLQYSIFSS